MAGKFEVFEDSGGAFRFRLKASNGEVVASGRGYPTKAAARRACKSVLRAAAGAPVVEAAVTPGQAGRSAPERGTDLVPSPRRRAATARRGPARRTPGPASVSEPVRRTFRFAGGMTSGRDLAARSEDVVRGEFGRER